MKKIFVFICFVWASMPQSVAQTHININGGADMVVGGTTIVKANTINNVGTGSNITNNGTLYLTHNFNQNTSATYTGGTSSWLWFQGTNAQTINSDATLAIARLKIDNALGVQLTQNITVSNNLDVVNGDLDLNGKNIDLGSSGVLSEDRPNNHLVKDNTALSDFVQGGGITFTAVVTDATTEIRGTGLYLQGATGASYPITVVRKHYKGAIESGNGHSIARIYQITGTPNQPTTMRVYYASDEAIGAGSPTGFSVYRWQSTTGWKNAPTSSGAFADGTNNTTLNFTEATGITAFSHWTVGSTAVLLPITLLGLKGERVEGLKGEMTEEVRLEWATASEINNKGFEIQVSDNAQTYKTISFVEGRGNSTTVNSYQLAVNNPSDSYYRLKQVDFDGKFSYSPVVFVEGIVGKVSVYPNPNNGTFTVVCGTQTTADKLDLPARLLNAQGQEVWKGTQTEVRTTGLPTGMYFLHTTVAGKTKVTKVIIYH